MAELRQIAFNEVSGPEIAAHCEQHLACILLLDTSSSMLQGNKIKHLNEGVKRFLNQTSMDELARKRVDVAIIEFNDTAQVVREFTPLIKTEPVVLEAKGCTAMGQAINLAIDMVKERNRFYNSMGTPCFKPWIVLFTDGEPTDDISAAAQRIKQEESKGSHGKLIFWSVGVDNYNLKVLAQLSKQKHIIELSDYNFMSFFDWLSESMVLISASEPGVQVSLPDLPENARPIRKNEIPDEWNEDCNW